MNQLYISKRYLLTFVLLLCSIGVMAQQKLTGTITDANNLPLPGVTVSIEGNYMGTTTDLDGNYSLTLQPGEYTVSFSFIGFTSQKQVILVENGKTISPINISMSEDIQKLDEFVVVGYGVQRKREVTGSISKVDAKEISALPVPSFESALQGQASGVQVTTGSGIAGSAAIVRVRGIASVSAAGDPLYVVDGIPITQDYFLRGNSGGANNNPLAAINPNDIESIEVLKDAAATGIYGSRGSNGVILITTKRAKKKGLSFDFTSRVGIAQPTALPNMLNSEEYLQLYQEAYENDGGTGLAPLPGGVSWEDARNTNTDWVDETVGTGVKQLYSFGVNKKTDKYGLYANLTYDDNQSYLVGNSFTRYSGRVNFDYNISEKLTANVSTSLSNAINNKVDAAWSGGLGAAMSSALPIYPIFYENDVYDTDSTLLHSAGDYFDGGSNPVWDRARKDWRVSEWRSINTLKLNYSPVKNLFITATGSYERMDLNEDQWNGARPNETEVGLGTATRYGVVVDNYNTSLIMNYIKNINEDHEFKFMLGSEYQYSSKEDKGKLEYSNMSGALYETDGQEENLLADEDSQFDDTRFQSVFGRVNYVLKGKYIAQLTGRVDGSSKFGPDNRFGFFPSASLGWIVSDEAFLQDNKLISYLKLKTSYGVTGNANIPSGRFTEDFILQENVDAYNGSGIIYKTYLDNPDLKWETSNNFDIGLELGILRDRITFEASYYRKYASDVLMTINLPKSLGWGEYTDNVAEILNRGYEFSIKTVNIDKGDFTWTSNFNIAHNYNEVKSIGLYSEDAVVGGTNDTRIVVGEPIGTNFLVRLSHIDPATGIPWYYTKDGELTTTWSPNDRVAVGDVLPDWVGGFTNTFNYKNWDLTLVTIFSVGGKIYDSSSKRQLGVVSDDWNMRTEIFDRWRQPGDESEYPILTRETETYGSGTPWINTDQWLKDGDYLRFRRLALGYTFDEFSIIKDKWKINSLRIEGSMTNFLTITNFDGLDPEIARDFDNAADRNMSQNVTYLTPPQERTYNLSINFKF